MQGQLFSGAFWAASHEPIDGLIAFERTPLRITTLAALDAEMVALEQALRSVDRRRTAALFDLRDAPVDPRADADELWARTQPAFAGFRRYAIVVRTAVGKLQVNRLAGAPRAPMRVFFDVADARRFCREPG